MQGSVPQAFETPRPVEPRLGLWFAPGRSARLVSRIIAKTSIVAKGRESGLTFSNCMEDNEFGRSDKPCHTALSIHTIRSEHANGDVAGGARLTRTPACRRRQGTASVNGVRW